MDDDEGAISRRTLLLGGLSAAVVAGGAGVYAERNSPTVRRLLGGCGGTPAVPHSDYTLTMGTLQSAAMQGSLSWVVALPPGHSPGDGTPVVLCLPGLRGGPGSMTNAVGLPGFATASGVRLALATPDGGGTSYWHPRRDGRDPLGYLLDEFLPMVEQRFGVGGSKDKRGTLGWSMGGFGALLVAQQRPDLVSAAVGMSPAVFPSYDAARSGHSYTFDSAADWQRYGLWEHLGDLSGTAVRIDCGDGDPFAPTVRELLKRIPGVTGHIGSGCHDNAFWRRSAAAELRFLAARLTGQQ
jgi:S-formylglutathione hydrolase FrmB